MPDKCSKCPYKVMVSFVRPTIEELRAYAKEIGWTNFDAEYFLAKNDSVGWVDNSGRPYVQWKGVMMVWFKATQKRGEIKPEGKSFKDKYLEHNKDMESQDDD